MTRREKLCLEKRNRKGQENETYCRHYIKCGSGYFRHVFFSIQSLGCFIMSAVSITIYLVDKSDDGFFGLIPLIIGGVTGFFWLGFILVGVWFWKYSRHVFVTNDGIWIMGFSTFWWRGAPDFTGKRRFLAPYWSLYSWSELKSVSKDVNTANRSVSKIANFFEDFDRFVTKSSRYSTIYLRRWDGVEDVGYIKNSDVEEILDYYKTQKKSRKKKVKEEDNLGQ